MELIRQEAAAAWELRLRSLRGTETVLALERGEPRLRGYVVAVSATGAFADVDDARWEEPRRVLIADVEAIRTPHFHEEGPEPPRSRPVRWRGREPEFPGQLRLGGSPPAVSRRSLEAAERAASMLLSQDLMDALGALDRACRRRRDVSSADVSAEIGKPVAWTVRRLARLAEMRLARAERRGRGWRWRPGE